MGFQVRLGLEYDADPKCFRDHPSTHSVPSWSEHEDRQAGRSIVVEVGGDAELAASGGGVIGAADRGDHLMLSCGGCGRAHLVGGRFDLANIEDKAEDEAGALLAV